MYKGEACATSLNYACGLLFLEERGKPEDDYSADDGRGKLTQKAAPRDSEQREQPSAEHAAQESEHDVHNEAETAAPH